MVTLSQKQKEITILLKLQKTKTPKKFQLQVGMTVKASLADTRPAPKNLFNGVNND